MIRAWLKRRVKEICWPDGTVYLRRYKLTPSTSYWRLYLHEILRPDWGRDPHSHPSWFLTLILSGGYWEAQYSDKGEFLRTVYRGPGLVYRPATFVHQIVSVKPGTWTLSVWGRRSQGWGFWVNGVYVSSDEYIRTRGIP